MSYLRALLVAGLCLPAIAAAAPAPVTVINGATLIHPSKSGDAVVEPGATIVIAGDRIQLAGCGIEAVRELALVEGKRRRRGEERRQSHPPRCNHTGHTRPSLRVTPLS